MEIRLQKRKPSKLKKTVRTRKVSRFTRKKRLLQRNKRNRMNRMNRMNSQLAVSYNQGYQAGYNEASQTYEALQTQEALRTNEAKPRTEEIEMRFEDGYRKGFYEGGDGLVDLNLPGLSILPEISIHQIIEAGVEKMSDHIYTLLDASEVADRIISALQTHSPLSLVRLGDGELLTLSQEVVYNMEKVNKDGHFLGYAGITLPDLEARDQLAESIKAATVVGIPKLRLPNFQPLAFSVFRAHGIDYHTIQLTASTINYSLYLEGYFLKILEGRRVLLVGNSTPELSQILTNQGFHVVDAIAPVLGVKDIPRVMGEIAARDFDIALVGAGIAAVIIAQRIASELGKVAIDFGHLANSMVNGEAPL